METALAVFVTWLVELVSVVEMGGQRGTVDAQTGRNSGQGMGTAWSCAPASESLVGVC